MQGCDAAGCYGCGVGAAVEDAGADERGGGDGPVADVADVGEAGDLEKGGVEFGVCWV